MMAKTVITMLLPDKKSSKELPYLYIYELLDHFVGSLQLLLLQ